MQLMDPLDAVLLTAEQLGNPMHVAALLLLTPPADAPPDYVETLYDEAVASAAEVDPRLLRRPHRGLDTGGLWGWQSLENIDVGDHLRRHTLTTGTREELWEHVSGVHETPLPRDRPLWEAVLVDGLADGRFAFYVKVHHALVDGITGFRMIEDSLSPDPGARGMEPFFALRSQPRVTTSRGRGFPNPLRLAGSAARTATGAAGLGLRIAEAQLGNVRQGLTSDTTVLPFRAPRTRLNGPLTAARTFASGAWERDRLRRVQAAAGDVTSNDVITAMIAGALRSWLREHDELPEDSLVAICPVTVRVRPDAPGGSGGSGGSSEAGNAFGTAVCNLGTASDDPLERLDVIHRSMAVAKNRVLELGPVPSLLVAAPSILPTILLPMLPFDAGFRPGYNLPISNVPGPREELYWNGAHLDEIYPVSVVYDGMALNVTVCSYAEHLCFGYVAGRDAVPDVDHLVSHTEGALAELEAALGL